MLKIFAILASSFIVGNSHGQQLSDIVTSVLSKERSISKVLSNPQLIKNNLLKFPYENDSLDFEVVKYMDFFNNKDESGQISSHNPEFQIVVYSYHDSIFFKKISSINFKQVFDKLKMESQQIYLYIDTTKLLKYINKYNSYYRSHWTLNDFINSQSNIASFGFECGGIVPTITNEAYSLAGYIKNNDSATLKSLASSFSVQDRAWGSVGLYILSLEGAKLSEGLIQLIEMNQKSKLKVSYCEGCVIRKKKLSEVLNSTNLKFMYNLLKEYKLL